MIEKMERKDFDRVYDILENSFPPDERRTYKEQKALTENPDYQIYVAKDKSSGDIKAFISVWDMGDILFVEHFAVSKKYRNGGLGTEILHELFRISDNTMICLEVEPPDNDIAARRVSFYERCGFFFNDYPYEQPPMSESESAIPLFIMTSGRAVSLGEFEKIRDLLYRKVYGISGE